MERKDKSTGWESHENDHHYSDVESRTEYSRNGQVVQIKSEGVTITRNDQGVLFEGWMCDLFSPKRKTGSGTSFYPHKK